MTSSADQPKRLVEVDLPIRRISEHARREKSIRHGHISTLHIWWARRPLAACRAVILAALWPDPVDARCPDAFRKAARSRMLAWAVDHKGKTSAESAPRLVAIENSPTLLDDPELLRQCLLDFIADFANWDRSSDKDYLETARDLVNAAHQALGGAPGERPVIADPFAGGGAIPLEALRVGADAFATDMNPVAVVLDKVVLEYIPKYGRRLADEVQRLGEWVQKEAEQQLATLYPRDPDGATPIAYLWARTIRCEGPGCGAEVPLIRALWLAKKGQRSIALRLVPDRNRKRVTFEVVESAKSKDVGDGTVRRGAASCPVCGYTTPVDRVRAQLKERRGGSHDARLFCVVTTHPARVGRSYRLPEPRDMKAAKAATEELAERRRAHRGPLSLVPDEVISLNELRRISMPIYGMTTWGDLFAPRQALALSTLSACVRRVRSEVGHDTHAEFSAAVVTCLALALDRVADAGSSLSTWSSTGEFIRNTFARQALPMVWDFVESSPAGDSSGNWLGAVEWIRKVCEAGDVPWTAAGQVELASATRLPWPDGRADAVVTDPPYYDAVPYAYLSDFFYVWMRRSLEGFHPQLLRFEQVPKDEEIVVDRPHQLSSSTKDLAFYERELGRAFADARRILKPTGVGVIVFASKTTASWEAVIRAVIDAGWVITGSWPIDTEREARIAAQGQARLGSSIHLVCRPREVDAVGDFREVLVELPKRMHEWMPRLADEGVVGADAIFACLGPALEIFSRYARVQKTSGDPIGLDEYLVHVWASVAKEALVRIFAGDDAAGFENDSRCTAMWLWTLSASTSSGNGASDDEDGEEDSSRAPGKAGFELEYDAARKIAQGLGAHLEELGTIVEVKGETARLLSVAERTPTLFPPLDTLAAPREPGRSILDRVHQAMLLFSAKRGDALRRFLVDDGAGHDDRFWRLAQALSALYPTNTDEKRWVDGVLARKKGLGF